MRRIISIIYAVIVLSILIITCKQPYVPPQTAINPNYLVVEGIINTGNDSTIIKLSRTVKLTSATTTSPETGATVIIESDANNTYALKEITAGTYASTPLNLDKSRKYRLRIKTSASKEYVSDFVENRTSPAIDSISYKTDDNNLYLYANTHDPSGNSRYYRWDYEETWQIHSVIYTDWKVTKNRDTILQRDFNIPEDNIYFCWPTTKSTTITLGSSVKLTQDVIAQNLLTTVPSNSEKLRIGYSLLVKQYVLTKDAFAFWDALSRNTQQLGSIFDAQPSQLFGNIHSTGNPDEVVIGYVSAGTISQKRILIFETELPQTFRYIDPKAGDCPIHSFLYNNAKVNEVAKYLYPANTIYVPIDVIPHDRLPSDPISGFNAAETDCVDCRLRGTNIKPSYWK